MVPALEFLDDCPSTLDAQFTAVLDAVAAAPPPWFSGGGKWEAMQGTMDRVLQARLPGGARARPRTPEELPAPHRDLVAAIAGDQGTRIRQQDAKSQTKSQRPQTPSHARRLPATITAARWHVRPLPAPSSHATDFAYKRGVRRFKSYCAHFSRISVGVSRRKVEESNKPKIYLVCVGARTVRRVDAASKNHVCSHPGPRWGLHDSHEHGESQGVQPPPNPCGP